MPKFSIAYRCVCFIFPTVFLSSCASIYYSTMETFGVEKRDILVDRVEDARDGQEDAKEQFQRRYINEILMLNNGNRTKTARDLGVDPRTIFRHLEKEEQNKGSKSSAS